MAGDSDNPTQFSDSTRGDVNKATLGGGKVKRERAPVMGAAVPDNPSTYLDDDAMDDGAVLG